MNGRKTEKSIRQAAQILPGTPFADMLIVFPLQEKKSQGMFIAIVKGWYFYLRHSRDYFDAQKGFSRPQYESDDEESLKVASSSVALSVLLIPSLKEVSTPRWLH